MSGRYAKERPQSESRLTYGEYKARRREKDRPDVRCVLFTGLGYLALAGVVLALYYRA